MSTVTNNWGQFECSESQIVYTPDIKYPKISNPYFSAWLNLCMDMANKENEYGETASLEVHCILLCNMQDWIIAIPNQNVSIGAVNNSQIDNCIDLITGEEYLNYNFPKGYRHYGSMH